MMNDVTSSSAEQNKKESRPPRPFSITSVVTASIAIAISLISMLFMPMFGGAFGSMMDGPMRGGFCEYDGDGSYDKDFYRDRKMEFSDGNFEGWMEIPRGGMFIRAMISPLKFILAVIGLVFGILGIRKEKQNNEVLPILGIVLSSVALFLHGSFFF